MQLGAGVRTRQSGAGRGGREGGGVRGQSSLFGGDPAWDLGDALLHELIQVVLNHLLALKRK